jgi:UDPglucose--hexose-1-phosphate uridylyltransferase
VSELRQDPTTFDWIIIAKERAKRPHEFTKAQSVKSNLPDHSPGCPFCPGNEDRTPETLAIYRSADPWSVRVVPNKFAALTPDGDAQREEWKLFRKSHGYGRHEVVIETPFHNQFFPLMDDSKVHERPAGVDWQGQAPGPF